MTLVGLDYLKLQESKRHNVATEVLSDKQITTQMQTADKDRESRELIASLDRVSRESIQDKDRQSRESIAELDRTAREDIAERDRLSREDIATKDRATREDIAEQDRTSRETVSYVQSGTNLITHLGSFLAGALSTRVKAAGKEDDSDRDGKGTGTATYRNPNVSTIPVPNSKPISEAGQTVVTDLALKRGQVTPEKKPSKVATGAAVGLGVIGGLGSIKLTGGGTLNLTQKMMGDDMHPLLQGGFI